MSSTSCRWHHLVNACEVGPPDLIVGSTWRRLFLATTLWAKPSCCLSCVTVYVCVIAAMRGRLLSVVVVKCEFLEKSLFYE